VPVEVLKLALVTVALPVLCMPAPKHAPVHKRGVESVTLLAVIERARLARVLVGVLVGGRVPHVVEPASFIRGAALVCAPADAVPELLSPSLLAVARRTELVRLAEAAK
jgi:hypothetical protein